MAQALLAQVSRDEPRMRAYLAQVLALNPNYAPAQELKASLEASPEPVPAATSTPQ
jgi:hypothetical protein